MTEQYIREIEDILTEMESDKGTELKDFLTELMKDENVIYHRFEALSQEAKDFADESSEPSASRRLDMACISTVIHETALKYKTGYAAESIAGCMWMIYLLGVKDGRDA